MNEEQLGKEEYLGVRASEIINDETFKQAVDKLKKIYLDEMIKTNIKEDEARKYLWLSYHNVDKIIQQLEQVMTTGELAKSQLKELKKYS